MYTARDPYTSLPASVDVSTDYSIHPIPGQQALFQTDERGSVVGQRYEIGQEISWDQDWWRGWKKTVRRLSGPIVGISPSGWINVRSRQCNLTFCVHPDDPKHAVRPA